MDNSHYLSLLAETYQGRLLEEGAQTHLYLGQPRITSPVLRRVIMTGSSFLIRSGEALKAIGVPGETPPFSSSCPIAATGNNSSVDV